MAATGRLSRSWEDLYCYRPLFTLYRRHLPHKRETVPPVVIPLSWETFPVMCVCPITLDATPVRHVPLCPDTALVAGVQAVAPPP
jgi:hypothetical protein